MGYGSGNRGRLFRDRRFRKDIGLLANQRARFCVPGTSSPREFSYPPDARRSGIAVGRLVEYETWTWCKE